jgi:ribose-phosphate pyrophosphokinase
MPIALYLLHGRLTQALREMKLLAGRSHKTLAEKISTYLQVPLGDVHISDFPNGETHVQIIENIRGCDVFLIQSLQAPANSYIMELLILIDAARRSAARITTVIPFFGYARQDHQKSPHTAITAKLIANLLAAAGAHRVLTMDLHTPQSIGFFDIPIDHLSAASVFIPYLKNKNSSPWSIASPDLGGAKRAMTYAETMHCPLIILAKCRRDDYNVEIIDAIGEIRDRHVLLIDDIAETGATLYAAAKFLRQNSAASVRAVVSHTVLTASGIKHLCHSDLEELITSNSTPVCEDIGISTKILDIAPLLGDAIRNLHENHSIAEHFSIDEY